MSAMNATAPLPSTPHQPRVGLFVTCLADLVRPQVGFATIKLLEEAGCKVEVPITQTCCGQPAFNSGATRIAAGLARQVVRAFEPFDYVVVPSGSCAGMIKAHYREALADDAAWLPRAQSLAAKTWELMSFLVDVRAFRPRGVSLRTSATYHDSCSGLRELGVFQQPRALLSAVDGLELKPLPGNDVCCGFGGTFCVKYPAISNAIVAEKAQAVASTGAAMLLGGDLGCLMNMAGKLAREGSNVRVMHAAEVLADMGAGPALGEEG
jgi:L-lactate dehydrogenase complex protein LldE